MIFTGLTNSLIPLQSPRSPLALHHYRRRELHAQGTAIEQATMHNARPKSGPRAPELNLKGSNVQDPQIPLWTLLFVVLLGRAQKLKPLKTGSGVVGSLNQIMKVISSNRTH